MINNLAKEMKQYLNHYQKMAEENKEGAVEEAKKNLVEMGYFDENLNILTPYNGTKTNDRDFSLGPNEIQYVKVNKKTNK